MTLKAEIILETINTKLQTLVPGTVATVYRNYPYTLNQAILPALQIVMGSDTPISQVPTNMTFQDWRLTVYVESVIKSSTVPLETEINAIRLAVHRTLMADITQGLSYVINTYPDVVEQPIQDSNGEEPVSVMRMGFTVEYRTQVNDPSA